MKVKTGRKYRRVPANQLKCEMTFHLEGDRTDWCIPGIPSPNGSSIHVHVYDPEEGRFDNFELEPAIAWSW